MRTTFTFLLFFSLFTSFLFAQSPPATISISNLTPGAHRPNEVLLHYDAGVSIPYVEEGVKAWVDATSALNDKNRPFTILRLTSTKTDFLVKFQDGFPNDMEICSVIDYNGGLHGPARSNGEWPNYLINTGVNVTGGNCPPDDPNPFTSGGENKPSLGKSEEEVTYDPLYLCHAPYDLNLVTGNESVKIAILDSGVDPVNHPDVFGGSIALAQGRDLFGHGTAVAGIIAGMMDLAHRDNSILMYPYSVLEDDGIGALSSVMQALDRLLIKAEHDIVNASIGFQKLPCDASDNTAISHLLAQADDLGIFLITSAGNAGNFLGTNPQFPAAEQGLDFGITVSALDCKSFDRAPFANYGNNQVDLMAPGVDILVPNVANECYLKANGTSFATPIVTAMIATYLSNGYTPEDVVCLIASGAVSQYGSHSDQDEDSRYGIAAMEGAHICMSGEESDQVGENLLATSNTSVYPNPTTGTVTISYPLEQETGQPLSLIGVYNANGKLLQQLPKTGTSIRIDLTELAQGTYWVKIPTARGNEVRTLIKN